MKVIINHIDSTIKKEDFKFYDNFIKYLQQEFPLKHDITIYFLGDRVGQMTTGSRTKEHYIKVLSKGRINRDILRTLTHEWVHEYQRTIMDRPHGPNIGGKNEDEANAESGKIMKKFERDFPKLEDKMYK